MKVVILSALLLAGCGDDLPPLMLTTAHVRYHARVPEDVPPEASAWLEDYRTDLLTYFGVLDSQRDAVIDYYRFSDAADLAANSPCPIACTGDQPVAIYTTSPLDSYELVHGFLAPIGDLPPYLIAEGAARNVSCYPHERVVADATVSSWPDLVGQGASNTQIAYGEWVVRYLLDQFGPARFIKYYADAHATKDPALFALDFERSFGMTFTSVWNAALSQSKVNPVCPCTLEPLTLDSNFVIEHPSGATYKPLDIPNEASLLLTLPPGSAPMLKDCANSVLQSRLATEINGTNLAVIKASGANYLSFPYGATERLTTAVGDWVSGACSTATPVPVSAATIGMAVVAPHTGEGSAYYLSLSFEGSRQVALRNAPDPVFGTFDLCTDCGLTTCSPLGTTPTAATGNVVVVIRLGLPGSGAEYAGTRLLFE